MLRFLILLLAVTPALHAQLWPNKEGKNHARDRQQWFYSQRVYPNSQIPAGARRDAILQIDRNDAAVRAKRQAAQSQGPAPMAFSITGDSTTWTSIGPRPTGPGTTNVTAGRVNAIAIDPRDNNVVYIGAAEGGVWKTTDGGARWAPLTDDQLSLATGAIALDPQNPDTLYVSTGEENFSGDSYYGAGILKSTDGGATWTNILGPFLRDRIGAIAVSPTDSQLVICAAQTGVWRSNDGGKSWLATSLSAVPAISVSFEPNSGSSVWATLGSTSGNAQNGVYHSTNGGLTWQAMRGTGNAVLPTANVGRIELAIAPSAPATMYAQIANSSTANFGALLGIYKTTDAGLTWARLPIANVNPWGTQLWYDNAIRVSPTDPNVVWSGALQVYRSLDGGQSWTSLSQTGGNGQLMHVDFHYFAFTPDGSKLYIANDGGMYSTSNVTSSTVNWTSLNSTLAITQFYPGMSLHPSDATPIVGGTQDNGTQQLAVDGNWSNVACGDGGFTAIDQAFPALAYAACQDIAIRRNIPVGTSSRWISAAYGIDQTDTVQFIAPFVIDPSASQNLYFGTVRVWQSRDSSGQWAAISPDLSGNNVTIRSIAVAPADSNVVYAGTSNGKLHVTADALKAGAVWTDRSAGLPGRAITKIAVDPLDASTAYVTFSGFPAATAQQGHIYRTTNRGANWTNVSGDLPVLPVNDLVIDPDLPQTLYIGTDAGVMLTTDGGATWSSLGNGLPKVVVSALALQRKSRVLRAATHGRSVWEIAIPTGRLSLRPEVTSITPATVTTGSPTFTLSVTGANFSPGTAIRWNGEARATRFVDPTHLSTDIPASDVALPGRAAVTAFTSSSGGGSSDPRGFLIGAAPLSASNAFVSAANPTGGSALAPGSIASLYGANLAGAVVSANTGPPLPFTLGDTTLTAFSSLVPLFFVSPTQINFQVPFAAITGPATSTLTVTQGVQTTTISIALRPFSPALFTANAQGTGQASTVIAATGPLAANSNAFPGSRPAKPGEALSIYCTGLGDVSNRPNLGAASPSSPPLAATLATPTVTIGGVNAVVLFSGLAPGFVGLYQVNVVVPDGVTPGDAVPLVVTIGGVPSNTATIAVQ